MTGTFYQKTARFGIFLRNLFRGTQNISGSQLFAKRPHCSSSLRGQISANNAIPSSLPKNNKDHLRAKDTRRGEEHYLVQRQGFNSN